MFCFLGFLQHFHRIRVHLPSVVRRLRTTDGKRTPSNSVISAFAPQGDTAIWIDMAYCRASRRRTRNNPHSEFFMNLSKMIDMDRYQSIPISSRDSFDQITNRSIAVTSSDVLKTSAEIFGSRPYSGINCLHTSSKRLDGLICAKSFPRSSNCAGMCEVKSSACRGNAP